MTKVTLAQLALDEAPGLALADDSGNDLSWSQVANQTNRMAHALRDIGFHDGSRLAVLGQNSVDVMLVYVAAKLAGIGAILVNYHLTVDEVEYVLGDGNAGAVWTSAECIATALEAAERLGIPVLNDVERSGRWRVAMAEAASGALSDELPASTDLIYTSGTTGSPKGVEFPAGPTPTLSDQLQLAARHHMAGLGPHLVVGPLYHAGPHTAVGLLLSGTPVVVTRRFDADLILRVIEGRRIASSIMVPTHFVRLLRLPERRRQAADVSSLRLVSVTGSHCPPQVKHSMIEWFGPVLLETYGASESGIITRITSEEWLSRPGSVGRPVAPFQIIVLDQEGGQCPPGRDGTLYFVDETKRGIRYHNDRKKTAAAHIVPGTFTLGDLGHLDEDGYLYVTGRSTDLVISGGVNIYPAECEHVLVQHPSVDDVALFGVPDPEMGERLVGLVVLRNDGSTAEELREFCRGALAGYKTPRDLVFVNEIPRTAMGKLDKRTLPEIYLGITRANQRDEANR